MKCTGSLSSTAYFNQWRCKLRYLIVLMIFILSGIAFGATGDKPNQMIIPFRNVSSSTKPAGCIVGEMKRNDAYVFMCASSSQWRRLAIGDGF